MPPRYITSIKIIIRISIRVSISIRISVRVSISVLNVYERLDCNR